jgi:hypothetical protein
MTKNSKNVHSAAHLILKESGQKKAPLHLAEADKEKTEAVSLVDER